MEEHEDMFGGKGHYLGTEIDGKWWKRYRRNKFFARGNGRYWLEQDRFCFHRTLTRSPICIPFDRIEKIRIGKWHAGRWCAGLPVLKILWSEEEQRLSSGFVVSRNRIESDNLKTELERRMGGRSEA